MIAKKRFTVIAIIILLMSGAVAAAYILARPAADSTGITPRPGHWARLIQREALPNLHQVTPTLYRGAQPTAVGMRQLKAMGVKTVVNLRSFNVALFLNLFTAPSFAAQAGLDDSILF